MPPPLESVQPLKEYVFLNHVICTHNILASFISLYTFYRATLILTAIPALLLASQEKEARALVNQAKEAPANQARALANPAREAPANQARALANPASQRDPRLLPRDPRAALIPIRHPLPIR